MWEANSCIWSSSSVEWIWKEKEKHTFVRMLSMIHCVKWNCWNEIESIISEPCLLGHSDSKMQKMQKKKMVVHIVLCMHLYSHPCFAYLDLTILLLQGCYLLKIHILKEVKYLSYHPYINLLVLFLFMVKFKWSKVKSFYTRAKHFWSN